MTDVKNTLLILKSMIEHETGKPAYILSDTPAAIDKGVVYIVAPAPGDITMKHFMSTSSYSTYPIHIYELIHTKDVSRQKDIVDNVYETYKGADCMLDKIHDRIKGWRKIGSSNICKYTYGINSWVVNTTVYSAYEVKFDVQTIIDD